MLLIIVYSFKLYALYWKNYLYIIRLVNGTKDREQIFLIQKFLIAHHHNSKSVH